MTIQERIELALDSNNSFESLYSLAIELRDSEMSNDELHRLYDQARARHSNDTDETKYDAILDVMYFITGFCDPSKKFFQNESE